MFENNQEKMEFIKSSVGQHFPYYEMRFENTLVFFCHEPDDLDYRFEELRKVLRQKGLFPTLRREGGELQVRISEKPEAKYRSSNFNVLLLFLTIGTTAWAGMLLWAAHKGTDDIYTMQNLVYGLAFFSLPLLLILGIHELGHYYASKRHGVASSLPFFIPIPPLMIPIGTFGALISMREPIPNKKALMEIGLAGPLCGILVAIPVTFIGIFLTNQYPTEPMLNPGDLGAVNIAFPLLMVLINGIYPLVESGSIHPTLFAGWVGLFVTGLNLLPLGQLDGGHVMKAMLGERTRGVYLGVVLILVGFSFLYTGWLMLLLLLLLLGINHPPPLNNITPLDGRGKIMGVLAISLLLLCFIPQPLAMEEPDYDFEYRYQDEATSIIELNTSWPDTILFHVKNTGNTKAKLTLAILENETLRNRGVGYGLAWENQLLHNGTLENQTTHNSPLENQLLHNSTLEFELNSTESKDVYLVLSDAGTLLRNESISIKIAGYHHKMDDRARMLEILVN